MIEARGQPRLAMRDTLQDTPLPKLARIGSRDARFPQLGGGNRTAPTKALDHLASAERLARSGCRQAHSGPNPPGGSAAHGNFGERYGLRHLGFP